MPKNFINSWQTKQHELFTLLKDPQLLKKLKEHNELNGHEDLQGRVTYNKVIDKKSFGQFNNIVSGIVPLDIVFDASQSQSLFSFCTVLQHSNVQTYKKYLYMHMNMEEFEDWQTEEDEEALTDFLAFANKHEHPTVAICLLRSEEMESAHAIAVIAHKNKIAYYDPLAYKRIKNTKATGYDFAERAFDASRFGIRVKFTNLSQYCLYKNQVEYHCPQYTMNAEYCYVYSLFFLYNWITINPEFSSKAFKKAVTASYIVNPELLSRSNTLESFMFRLVIMSFTMSSLSYYLRRLKKDMQSRIEYVKFLKQLEEYDKAFEDSYGVGLLC